MNIYNFFLKHFSVRTESNKTKEEVTSHNAQQHTITSTATDLHLCKYVTKWQSREECFKEHLSILTYCRTLDYDVV
jgi:hypothetical protein